MSLCGKLLATRQLLEDLGPYPEAQSTADHTDPGWGFPIDAWFGRFDFSEAAVAVNERHNHKHQPA